MNRRRFLEVIGGVSVGITGCLGQRTGSNSSSPASPTDSPTATATPEAGSRVTVPPCPTKPASLTRDTALQFTTQFEKAYLTRTVLRDRERIISVDIDIGSGLTDKTATQTDAGWLARFTVTGPAYRYRPDPNATTTAHADPPVYVANYLITDQAIWRARATEAVNPRQKGTTITCPPA